MSVFICHGGDHSKKAIGIHVVNLSKVSKIHMEEGLGAFFVSWRSWGAQGVQGHDTRWGVGVGCSPVRILILAGIPTTDSFPLVILDTLHIAPKNEQIQYSTRVSFGWFHHIGRKGLLCAFKPTTNLDFNTF
jgi:hypothetical protein